jgi:hypothetical protein
LHNARSLATPNSGRPNEEGALFYRLPSLVLAQRDALPRVVFDKSFGGYVGEFEADSDVGWLHTQEFRVPFGYWLTLLNQRQDVFLGYSSKSGVTAAAIKRYLLSLGAKVLDWQTDFIPGRTILDQIEQAATRSVGGIFLSPRMTTLQTTARQNWPFHAITLSSRRDTSSG